MLDHTISLNKFQVFSDYNGIEVKINKGKKFGKFTNMWKLSNTLLNYQCVKNKKEIRKYFEVKKQRYNIPKFMGCS